MQTVKQRVFQVLKALFTRYKQTRVVLQDQHAQDIAYFQKNYQRTAGVAWCAKDLKFVTYCASTVLDRNGL